MPDENTRGVKVWRKALLDIDYPVCLGRRMLKASAGPSPIPDHDPHEPCPDCNGTGLERHELCPTCNGRTPHPRLDHPSLVESPRFRANVILSLLRGGKP